MDSQTYANIAEGEDLSTPDRNGMRYMMSYLRSLVTSADHEGTLRAGSGYSSHFMESERLSRLRSFLGMIAIFMWRRAACGPGSLVLRRRSLWLFWSFELTSLPWPVCQQTPIHPSTVCQELCVRVSHPARFDFVPSSVNYDSVDYKVQKMEAAFSSDSSSVFVSQFCLMSLSVCIPFKYSL